MKRYYAAAAGALLLGTSAIAWAADKPVMESDSKTAMTWDKSAMTFDKAALTAKSDLAATSDSKLEFASLEKDLEKLAATETDTKLALGDAKLQTAAYDSWSDSKVETASMDDSKLKTAWSDTDKVETAWTDGDAKVQTASYDKTEAGMGGPLEETSATTTSAVVSPSNADPEHDARGIPVLSDVAYVPSGYNGSGGAMGGPVEGGDDESYPACTRERTDNCIQLYERGVRASLASSSADGSTTTAMGGPYEPADADGTKLAMNDTAKVETSDAASDTDMSVAGHSDHQGVGGPIEAQSGYPPCSPGPGDDRCIQLYEPGVTGAGN